VDTNYRVAGAGGGEGFVLTDDQAYLTCFTNTKRRQLTILYLTFQLHRFSIPRNSI